jgi:hypothetical protein
LRHWSGPMPPVPGPASGWQAQEFGKFSLQKVVYRHSRYVGLPKTHFQHLATAAAVNLIRLHAWHNTPSRTRTLRFVALKAA